MMKIGDIVLYGANGICEITAVCEMDFGGKKESYFSLSPLYDAKSVLYVPTENEVLTRKMHALLPKKKVEVLLSGLQEEAPAWIAHEPTRKLRYKELLEGNSREELLLALKALIKHKTELQASGKKLHVCDERFFKDAQRRLLDEFSYVLKKDPEKLKEQLLKSLSE